MSSMKLVVVGAAGRMGRTLVRVIAETDGVELAGAIERSDSTDLGSDAGTLAGLPENGVAVSDDALAAFVKADGVLDFSVPEATTAFAEPSKTRFTMSPKICEQTSSRSTRGENKNALPCFFRFRNRLSTIVFSVVMTDVCASSRPPPASASRISRTGSGERSQRILSI